jgi:hypothetical protein
MMMLPTTSLRRELQGLVDPPPSTPTLYDTPPVIVPSRRLSHLRGLLVLTRRPPSGAADCRELAEDRLADERGAG